MRIIGEMLFGLRLKGDKMIIELDDVLELRELLQKGDKDSISEADSILLLWEEQIKKEKKNRF